VTYFLYIQLYNISKHQITVSSYFRFMIKYHIMNTFISTQLLLTARNLQ